MQSSRGPLPQRDPSPTMDTFERDRQQARQVAQEAARGLGAKNVSTHSVAWDNLGVLTRRRACMGTGCRLSACLRWEWGVTLTLTKARSASASTLSTSPATATAIHLARNTLAFPHRRARLRNRRRRRRNSPPARSAKSSTTSRKRNPRPTSGWPESSKGRRSARARRA
jgi:hypothetical protein